jgi:hypothetical protein
VPKVELTENLVVKVDGNVNLVVVVEVVILVVFIFGIVTNLKPRCELTLFTRLLGGLGFSGLSL